MPERSQDWLNQAERDLEEASWSMQGGFYEWVCFISQQAAEKAVKALYMHLHGEAWGHSISRLLMALPEDYGPSSDLIEKALFLDRLYIPPRYPNSFDSGAPKDYFLQKDAQEALDYAGEIIKFCKDKIS